VINFSSSFIFLWEFNSLNLKKWFLIFMTAYVSFTKFKDILFIYFLVKQLVLDTFKFMYLIFILA